MAECIHALSTRVATQVCERVASILRPSSNSSTQPPGPSAAPTQAHAAARPHSLPGEAGSAQHARGGAHSGAANGATPREDGRTDVGPPPGGPTGPLHGPTASQAQLGWCWEVLTQTHAAVAAMRCQMLAAAAAEVTEAGDAEAQGRCGRGAQQPAQPLGQRWRQQQGEAAPRGVQHQRLEGVVDAVRSWLHAPPAPLAVLQEAARGVLLPPDVEGYLLALAQDA